LDDAAVGSIDSQELTGRSLPEPETADLHQSLLEFKSADHIKVEYD
jgi:hypothetical protein